VVLELVRVALGRESLRQSSLLLLLLGTLGAAAAVGAGLEAEDHIDHGPALHEVMEEHQELAYVTLGIFAVLSIWRLARDRKMGRGERASALVLGLVGLAVLADTGHHGGVLVFEHAAGVSNAAMRAELENRALGHEHGGHAPDADHHDHADDHADDGAEHQHTQ
jgi:uncharacterized membrane protein